MEDIHKLLFFVLVLALLHKCHPHQIQENFSSRREKEMRNSPDTIYDDFYSGVYDTLFHSESKNSFEVQNIKKLILNKWKPKKDIKILDAGCGTGKHTKLMSKEFNVTGIDNSDAMLNKAKSRDSKGNYLKGNLGKKNLFDPNTFTHILSFFYTPYYFQDIGKLFQNFYLWLKPQGIVGIHLVDKNKFDPLLDKYSSLIPLYNPQKKSNKRENKSILYFKKFKYLSDWNFSNKKKTVFTENFVFKNGNIRTHKHTLYIKPLKTIVKQITNNGFHLIEKLSLANAERDNEFIYFFKKI